MGTTTGCCGSRSTARSAELIAFGNIVPTGLAVRGKHGVHGRGRPRPPPARGRQDRVVRAEVDHRHGGRLRRPPPRRRGVRPRSHPLRPLAGRLGRCVRGFSGAAEHRQPREGKPATAPSPSSRTAWTGRPRSSSSGTPPTSSPSAGRSGSSTRSRAGAAACRAERVDGKRLLPGSPRYGDPGSSTPRARRCAARASPGRGSGEDGPSASASRQRDRCEPGAGAGPARSQHGRAGGHRVSARPRARLVGQKARGRLSRTCTSSAPRWQPRAATRRRANDPCSRRANDPCSRRTTSSRRSAPPVTPSARQASWPSRRAEPTARRVVVASRNAPCGTRGFGWPAGYGDPGGRRPARRIRQGVYRTPRPARHGAREGRGQRAEQSR